MPECSIIIPVYNKWELTQACLASLHEHTAGCDIEVIVADNGSSDATACELTPFGEQLFGSRFHAVVFPENRNFGPACNAGARSATSPVLFFLNNDTIMTPDWLPPLLEALSSVDVVGPLLLYENGTVQHLGIAYGAWGPLHLYQEFPADHPVVAKPRDLQCLTGAALMLRAETFHDCGGFYEEYRNGFEDLDLCVQLRKRNKVLRCVPASRVYHLESRTPGRKDWETQNSELFTRRCGKDALIDLHHHALRDGFSIFITDLFTIGVKLKEKDERSLNAEAAGKDAAVVLRLTETNPYWIGGREVLSRSLEQAGRPEDAVPFRIALAEIEPTISRYKDLLNLAPLVKETVWLPATEKYMTTILRYASDIRWGKIVLKQLRQRMKPGGDPFLEDLLAAKLRAMFPEG